jgi:hypothetical protein
VLLDGDAFAARLSDFQRSAWRLETQPSYAIPREAETFARFLAGEPKPDGFNAKWEERVRANVDPPGHRCAPTQVLVPDGRCFLPEELRRPVTIRPTSIT